jgi:hypothetical protein
MYIIQLWLCSAGSDISVVTPHFVFVLVQADFNDPVMAKVVPLDEACRRQQLGEGWYV